MARTSKPKPQDEDPPVELNEPDVDDLDEDPTDEAPWMRGLHMVIFAVLFEIAKWLLLVAAVLQFLWLLFAKERNGPIADFGKSLANWMARVARFQTAATEDKPFPWRRWGE